MATSLWQILELYRNEGDQIMPITLLRAPPDFQTFRRPWLPKAQSFLFLSIAQTYASTTKIMIL